MERVQVEIFGQSYNLKGGNDPRRIRELAAFVDGKMRDVQKGTGTVDPHRVAILASLMIADELHQLRAEHEELVNMAEQAADHLLDLTSQPNRK